MRNAQLKLVVPTTEKRTVTPKRLPNRDLRTREYLTDAEVERLMNAARKNRWGHRDAAMVLVGYRHGLRASELVDLRWDQVDFRTATLHVRRVEAGHALHPPDPRGRVTGAPATSARAGAQVAVRVHVRTRGTLQHRWFRPHGRAGRDGGEAWL